MSNLQRDINRACRRLRKRLANAKPRPKSAAVLAQPVGSCVAPLPAGIAFDLIECCSCGAPLWACSDSMRIFRDLGIVVMGQCSTGCAEKGGEP